MVVRRLESVPTLSYPPETERIFFSCLLIHKFNYPHLYDEVTFISWIIELHLVSAEFFFEKLIFEYMLNQVEILLFTTYKDKTDDGEFLLLISINNI